MKKKLAVLAVILALWTTGCAGNEETAKKTQGEAWVSTFTDHQPDQWEMSSGYSNGDPFDCVWSSGNILFPGSHMELTLTKNDTGGIVGSEYKTRGNYHYGKYEVRMKPAKNIGIVSSFFVYTGPSFGTPWDEIDIEFLGKDTTKVQLNYYTDGVGGNEKIIDLGYDASEQFHDYAFEWTKEAINWYIDGKLVHTATENLPVTPAKMMMNLWNGTGVDEWLGPYDGASPLTASYEWVKFTPYAQE
ncbi:beta-glucanase [Paenibacillus antibioticophila]|uniref:Beta-glucanase n=1 Tax=Paenibacillus antibioticophila TaxID=1274374 RepID=A0A919XWL7_9BACL|nr:glycoside hydrolase family 16 protein [Paenibacillus antibioticophila]GIO37715.1 beta-glucanase [Paenibacillus antibioticophila]